MSLSLLASEDVGVLNLGPSFLMADPMGPLLDQDEEEEEALSPSSSLEGKFSASSPLSFSSPPPSPPPTHPSLFLGSKVDADSLSVPWLAASDLLDVGADDGSDAFAGMDWMSEKIDLSEFDLDSLIGSSDESPSSPEDLLASLESHVDLDLDSINTPIPAPHESLDLSLPSIPSLPLVLPHCRESKAKKTDVDPDQHVVLKCEPPSPVYMLELRSEVDVLDADKLPLSLAAPSGGLQTSSPMVHLVVVLSNQDESSIQSLPDQSIKTSPPSSDCDSDSGIESVAGSPPRLASPPTAGSSRTKPYSKPETPAKTSRVKSCGGPKPVEKKLKKMEQNKTAATRYRQKKRVEQDLLNTECEGLEKKNCELVKKAESISREIQYLKDLMEEVRKRRIKTTSVV